MAAAASVAPSIGVLYSFGAAWVLEHPVIRTDGRAWEGLHWAERRTSSGAMARMACAQSARVSVVAAHAPANAPQATNRTPTPRADEGALLLAVASCSRYAPPENHHYVCGPVLRCARLPLATLQLLRQALD